MNTKLHEDVLNIYGNDTVTVHDITLDFDFSESGGFVTRNPEELYELMYRSMAVAKFNPISQDIVKLATNARGTDMTSILSALMVGNAAEEATQWFEKPIFEMIRRRIKHYHPYELMAGAVLNRVFNLKDDYTPPQIKARLEKYGERVDHSRYTKDPKGLVELAIELSSMYEVLKIDLKGALMETSIGREGEVLPGMAGMAESKNALGRDHKYTILNVHQVPIKLEDELEDLTNQILVSLDRKIVRVGPFVTVKAWQLSYGNTKVFEHQMRHDQELIILVDLSSSMDCWCGCAAKSRGYIAFQLVGAITKSYPRAKVYGFCSDDDANFIVPLEAGHMPECRRIQQLAPGNPDCVALMFMAEQCVLDHTTAVIISDGEPEGPSPATNFHLLSHTKQLAQQLHSQGTKFVSVLAGTHRNIYPSEIEAYLDEVSLPETEKVLLKIRDLGSA